MIDLYTYETGNGWRASLMLEASGLPYRAHRIDLEKGRQNSPRFRKINPLGQIPVIVDRVGAKKVVVAQSAAIILYLAEKSGRLLPRQAAKRAAALQWMMKAVTDLSPASAGLYYMSSLVPDASPKTKRFFKQRLMEQFRDFDRQLGNNKYLAGAQMTVADVALYPTVVARQDIVAKAKLPNLARWAAAMARRPAVKRGLKVPG